MNKLLTIILITSVLFACEQGPKSDLDKLIERRDSLQTEMNTLKAQIAEIDTAHVKESALVSIDTLSKGKFEHYFEVQGIVEAQNNITLVAEIPAVITKIHVKEGDRVKKGTLLVTLDDKIITDQIEELKIKLKLATFVYEKQKNLREENIGSELDYETALNNKESLERSLQTANTQLDKAKIRAPYTGVVDNIYPRTGEMAGPQFPLIRFIALGQVSIKVDVPESYLSKIKEGDEVEVKFPDLGISHISVIKQRGSFIQPLNRSFTITIDLPKDVNLLPNLIGVVKIKDFEKEDALLIHQENIMQDSEGNDYVFKVDQNEGKYVARKIFVDRGINYKNYTYIISGLEANDRIVSDGSRSIVDGESIRWNQ
jgi:RND family efflux transporter MFP subunit